MKNKAQKFIFIGAQFKENVMATSDSLLIQLSKAASFAFKDDGTSPGIVVSTLKDGQIYVSVVRYGTKFTKGKEVVCNVYANDLDTALRNLGKMLLTKVASPPTNPLETLRATVEK